MKEQRRYSRTSLDVEVLFTAQGVRGTMNVRSARSKDISLSGMFVVTSTPSPFGTSVLVQFVLPEQQDQLALPGIVRWVNDDEGMGVQFGLLGARETYAITQYIATRPTPKPVKLRQQR